MLREEEKEKKNKAFWVKDLGRVQSRGGGGNPPPSTPQKRSDSPSLALLPLALHLSFIHPSFLSHPETPAIYLVLLLKLILLCFFSSFVSVSIPLSLHLHPPSYLAVCLSLAVDAAERGGCCVEADCAVLPSFSPLLLLSTSLHSSVLSSPGLSPGCLLLRGALIKEKEEGEGGGRGF